MKSNAHNNDIRYVSTRGDAIERDFREVQLNSLAPDGGLYVPTRLPHYDLEQIRSWREWSYDQIAYTLAAPFVGKTLSRTKLTRLLKTGYREAFNKKHPAPVRPLDHTQRQEYVLELFHGPTFSFKDLALQINGRILGALLGKDEYAIALGATSGDTGSAAISGYKNLPNVDIVMMHPEDRIAEIQRRQMTTIRAHNVHNLALQGDYDECQEVLKACLNRVGFLPPKYTWVTVNSINWARIMLQTAYYFSAFIDVGAPEGGVCFSVPTGNFGNIYAGYLARRMGLPIRKLIAGVNPNSILPEFIETGLYPHKPKPVVQTLAPSMDIAVPSNLERLLFDLMERDGTSLARKIKQWQSGAPMEISPAGMAELRGTFACYSVDDEALCATIKEIYRNEHGYILDPHSAAGVAAGRLWAQANSEYDDVPMIYIATAKPIKFPEAIKRAINVELEMGSEISAMLKAKEHHKFLNSEPEAVEQYIECHVLERGPVRGNSVHYSYEH